MSGIDHEKPWGFFNGTSQRIPGICDAGVVLLLRFKTLFSFKVHYWARKQGITLCFMGFVKSCRGERFGALPSLW